MLGGHSWRSVALHTCTDLKEVMNGSIKWKPGPLVDVSSAPPLQEKGELFSLMQIMEMSEEEEV